MAQVRVDYASLAAVAQQLSTAPQRLAEGRQTLATVRTMTPSIGEPRAAEMTSEVLRQLGWFLEMGAASSAGLAQALAAAARDYEEAEQIVVRSEQG